MYPPPPPYIPSNDRDAELERMQALFGEVENARNMGHITPCPATDTGFPSAYGHYLHPDFYITPDAHTGPYMDMEDLTRQMSDPFNPISTMLNEWLIPQPSDPPFQHSAGSFPPIVVQATPSPPLMPQTIEASPSIHRSGSAPLGSLPRTQPQPVSSGLSPSPTRRTNSRRTSPRQQVHPYHKEEASKRACIECRRNKVRSIPSFNIYAHLFA